MGTDQKDSPRKRGVIKASGHANQHESDRLTAGRRGKRRMDQTCKNNYSARRRPRHVPLGPHDKIGNAKDRGIRARKPRCGAAELIATGGNGLLY